MSRVVHRHYVRRHKVKAPCSYCGYDIMHDGVDFDRCTWAWTMAWLGFWYRLGIQVTLDQC